MDATCKTCPFWHGIESSTAAACSRNPPIGERTKDGPGGRWPWTGPRDWCGEHPLRQRDRLAAMAMQGLVTDPSGLPGFGGVDPDADRTLGYGERVARAAYSVADAMLASRSPSVSADAGEGKEG